MRTKPVNKLVDAALIDKALAEAGKYRGACAPNPAVGAVVAKNGEVLDCGAHEYYGAKHAETTVIDKLSLAQTEGATLYVTLEPCCHFGKQPPCTEAIIAAGFARVVYAYTDPNPLVAGKGHDILIKQGVLCEQISVPAVSDFYESYSYWHANKRPFVTVKIAMSLDGKISHSNGGPIRLTGDEAAVFTHESRLRSNAILTTAQTINLDDPKFNVRLQSQEVKKKLFIVDRELSVNHQAQIFNTSKEVCLLHCREKYAPYNHKNVRYIGVAEEDGKVNLKEVMDAIGHEGIHDLWVEAGGSLLASLLQYQLVNRLYVFIAAKSVVDGRQAFYNYDWLTTAQKQSWKVLGQDACLQVDF